MQRLGLAPLVDQQLPTLGSNRGYRKGAIKSDAPPNIFTMWLLFQARSSNTAGLRCYIENIGQIPVFPRNEKLLIQQQKSL